MRVRELKITYGALESCGEQVNNRIQAAWFVRRRTEGDPRESFFVFHLNNNHEIISFETVSIGMINQTLVHPREVFRAAIAIGAAAIIIGHNHPSGHAQPSREDIQVTKNLVEAGEILGIPVVDHLVVTAGGFYSFKLDSVSFRGSRQPSDTVLKLVHGGLSGTSKKRSKQAGSEEKKAEKPEPKGN